jgi:hypothetical protein
MEKMCVCGGGGGAGGGSGVWGVHIITENHSAEQKIEFFCFVVDIFHG